MAVQSVKIKAFGSEYNCTHESGNTWKVSVVTPETSSYNQPNHYYPIEVEAKDEAGNTKSIDVGDETLGSLLKLIVKETQAPVISITSPTAGTKTAEKRPQIVFTITDNDSGVDESTVKLTLGGQEYTVSDFSKESISGGFRYTYTPNADLPDDEYTATVSASDNDGNAATPKSVTFEVYAAAPTLSVISPAEDLITNQSTVQYQVQTNGETLEITVNNAPQEVSLSGGTASGTIALTEGQNTIVFTAASETGVETKITRYVTLDTQAPTITGVQISENPATTGATIIFTITVED